MLNIAQKQGPSVVRGPSERGGASTVSRLVQRVKVVLGHYRASSMKASHADCASVPLSDQLLKTLNQKNPVLKTLQRIFSSTSTPPAAKQANKALAADFLQTSGLMLAERGSALSLTAIETMAYQLAAEKPNDLDINAHILTDRQQLNKYIHKAAPSALKWFKNNAEDINRARQSIQDRLQAMKKAGEEYGIDVTSLQSDFDQHVLRAEVERGPLPGQMLSTLLDLERNPLAFETQDGTQLLISGRYLQTKGPQWVHDKLPVLAKELEHQIDDELKDFKDVFSGINEDWGRFILTQRADQRLMKKYSNPKHSELGANCPGFLRQLIQSKFEAPSNYTLLYKTKNQLIRLESPIAKEKGIAWRTKTFTQEVKRLEQALVEQYTELINKSFADHDVPSLDKLKLKLMLANTQEFETEDGEVRMQSALAEEHPILKSHPALLDPLLDAVLKDSELLFFHPSDAPVALNKFRGGYLKGGENNRHSEKTRVKAASGKVYELLNTLNVNDSKDIKSRHDFDRTGKVLLGEGGFGRVRLARDLETGQIVAVKKFSVNMKNHPVDAANAELNRFGFVREALRDNPSSSAATTSASTLHDYKDYAHVKVTSHKKPGVVADKSYVFMDFANQGSGKQKIDELARLRSSNPTLAKEELIRVAKQYIKSVADLHELGFSHRDIKPANFLHFSKKVDGKNIEYSKLSDFGTLNDQRKDDVFGGFTYRYLSPEARLVCDKKNAFESIPLQDPKRVKAKQEYLDFSKHYDAKAHDSFSLGVTLFELYKAASGRGGLKLKYPQGTEVTVRPVVIFENGGMQGLDLLGYIFEEGNIEHVIAQLLNQDKDQRISPKDAYDQLLKVEEAFLKQTP